MIREEMPRGKSLEGKQSRETIGWKRRLESEAFFGERAREGEWVNGKEAIIGEKGEEP